MLVVPTRPVPNQTFHVLLGGQDCTLNIYQRTTGLFMDVLVGGVQIIGGVVCQNLNRIVRSLYLGFIGDLAWVDLQGNLDPNFTGLGFRWFLVYLSPAEVPPLPYST